MRTGDTPEGQSTDFKCSENKSQSMKTSEAEGDEENFQDFNTIDEIFEVSIDDKCTLNSSSGISSIENSDAESTKDVRFNSTFLIEFSLDDKEKQKICEKNCNCFEKNKHHTVIIETKNASPQSHNNETKPKIRHETKNLSKGIITEKSTTIKNNYKLNSENVNAISHESIIKSTEQINQPEDKNDNSVQCARECLNVASVALNELQQTCDLYAEENKALKEKLSIEEEKYSREKHNNNKLFYKADKYAENLNSKVEWFKEENRKLQDEIITSKEEFMKIYKSLTESNKLIEKFDEKQKGLKNKINSMKNEFLQLKDMHSNVQQNLALYMTKNAKLDDDNEILLKQNKNLSRETEYLKNEIEAIENELKNIKNDNRKLQSVKIDTENKIQDLINNSESINDERSLLSKLNQELSNKLEISVKECKVLTQENKNLTNINRDLKFQSEKLNMKIDEIKGHSSNDLNSLRRELAAAKARAASLEQQLELSRTPRRLGLTPRTSNKKLELQKESAYYEQKCRELKKTLKKLTLGQSIKNSPRIHVQGQNAHYSMTKLSGSVFNNDESKIDSNSTQLDEDYETLIKNFTSKCQNDEDYETLNKNITALMLKERDEYWTRILQDIQKENVKLKGKIAAAARAANI